MACEPERLSGKARTLILDARRDSCIAIAAITLYELAWIAQRKKIRISTSVESFLREIVSQVKILPISPEIAACAVGLPADFPKDPADRLIAATALVEGVSLVTADEKILNTNTVNTIW
jgi:PIN domain nuclease of toxin-antitoxin system